MRVKYLIRNIVLCLLILFSIRGFAQKPIKANQIIPNKLKQIGISFIYPLSVANIEDIQVQLTEEKKLSLTNYNINTAIGVNYSLNTKLNNKFLSRFEGGLNLKFFKGEINYRRKGANIISNGFSELAFLEERIDLRFKNVFFGATCKYFKNLNNSGTMNLIFGIDMDGRIINSLESSVSTYLVDNLIEPNVFEDWSHEREHREKDLNFLLINPIGGIGTCFPLGNNFIAIDILYSHAIFQIHNAGTIRINPISINVKYTFN